MACRFCVQCRITDLLFKQNPYKNWPKGNPQDPHLQDPIWTQFKYCGNCVLHGKLRLSECLLSPTLQRCNGGYGGFTKEQHMKHLVDDCYLPGFALFGPDIAAPCSGKKTASFHTPLTGGKWVKFLHNFDLERVYSEEQLMLAHILFSLFGIITFGLERRHGSIGFLSGREIRVLSLLMIDVFITLYGVEPSARYVHYLTTHMCEWKDELSAIGLDLIDFSTVSSEFLQKNLRQGLDRASNYHSDAPMQVAARSVRLRCGKAPTQILNAEEIARRKQKEINRHARLFKKHKCTRYLFDWLPKRVAGTLTLNF